MEKEGEGKMTEAAELFLQGWNEASTDLEKVIAAHYVARHQQTVSHKLNWDETALHFALKLHDDNMKGFYPSLYLNIAKCYEDMKDFDNAKKNYNMALSYVDWLPEDGYGSMIKAGIAKGINRVFIDQH